MKKEKPNGCSIAVILVVVIALIYYFVQVSDNEDKTSLNPCFISETFIKKNLKNPDDAEFPLLDCNVTEESGNRFTILRKVKAVNSFGVHKTYIYKVELEYKGGISSEASNWELLNMKNEEYK